MMQEACSQFDTPLPEVSQAGCEASSVLEDAVCNRGNNILLFGKKYSNYYQKWRRNKRETKDNNDQRTSHGEKKSQDKKRKGERLTVSEIKETRLTVNDCISVICDREVMIVKSVKFYGLG